MSINGSKQFDSKARVLTASSAHVLRDVSRIGDIARVPAGMKPLLQMKHKHHENHYIHRDRRHYLKDIYLNLT